MDSINNVVLESAKTNPTITKPQRGKMRLTYFTVSHPRNPVCGHKLDLTRTPRFTNCRACWDMLFNNVERVTQGATDIVTKDGFLALEQAMGRKFVKYFKKYAPNVVLDSLKTI